MGIDFLALASFGFLETAAIVPTAPTIVSTDHEDGTGVTIALSGYDAGTTNTLYTTQDAITWVDRGSTWVSDEMDLALANGVYYAYVASSNGELSTNSPVIRVTASNIQEAADDNVRPAIKTMKATGVYWPPETQVDDFGKPVSQDPFEIGLRWDDTQEEFIDEEGTTQVSKAKLMVDRDLKKGGVIMLGELTDIVDHVTPKNNPNAWEIRAILKTPDFKGNKYLREAYL